MISSFTAAVIIFSCYQLTFITAYDLPDKYDDAGLFWNGPPAQNDANSYVQYVQKFWTDERISAAGPRSMIIDDNNDNGAKSFSSGGKVTRWRNLLLFYPTSTKLVLIFLGESITKLYKVFSITCAFCSLNLYYGVLYIPF